MEQRGAITHKEATERLRLVCDSGRLYWTGVNKFHAGLNGKEAGGIQRNPNGKNYWVISIDGFKYKRGRLVYFILNGNWPMPCIDHINGDSLDDRPINLRQATIAENAMNHKKRRRRIPLPMGVRHAPSGGYQARISLNKKQIHLGVYKTPSEASEVYQLKRKELFREFA